MSESSVIDLVIYEGSAYKVVKETSEAFGCAECFFETDNRTTCKSFREESGVDCSKECCIFQRIGGVDDLIDIKKDMLVEMSQVDKAIIDLENK